MHYHFFFFFTVGGIEYYRFQLQVKAVLLYIIMALSAYELNFRIQFKI